MVPGELFLAHWKRFSCDAIKKNIFKAKIQFLYFDCFLPPNWREPGIELNVLGTETLSKITRYNFTVFSLFVCTQAFKSSFSKILRSPRGHFFDFNEARLMSTPWQGFPGAKRHEKTERARCRITSNLIKRLLDSPIPVARWPLPYLECSYAFVAKEKEVGFSISLLKYSWLSSGFLDAVSFFTASGWMAAIKGSGSCLD